MTLDTPILIRLPYLIEFHQINLRQFCSADLDDLFSYFSVGYLLVNRRIGEVGLNKHSKESQASIQPRENNRQYS